MAPLAMPLWPRCFRLQRATHLNLILESSKYPNSSGVSSADLISMATTFLLLLLLVVQQLHHCGISSGSQVKLLLLLVSRGVTIENFLSYFPEWRLSLVIYHCESHERRPTPVYGG